ADPGEAQVRHLRQEERRDDLEKRDACQRQPEPEVGHHRRDHYVRLFMPRVPDAQPGRQPVEEDEEDQNGRHSSSLISLLGHARRMARTMPRLRLLCCRLATTEVGEYGGECTTASFATVSAEAVSRRTSATLLHCCAAGAQQEATATTQTSRRGYEARLTDEIEALPLERGSGGALVARSPHRAVDARS